MAATRTANAHWEGTLKEERGPCPWTRPASARTT